MSEDSASNPTRQQGKYDCTSRTNPKRKRLKLSTPLATQPRDCLGQKCETQMSIDICVRKYNPGASNNGEIVFRRTRQSLQLVISSGGNDEGPSEQPQYTLDMRAEKEQSDGI